MIDTPIPIKNAGIVILNAYLKVFFLRLALTEKKAFKSPEAQIIAAHCLQNVITGANTDKDSSLVLNKILCGIDVSTPIINGFEISAEQKSLVEGLLKAGIAYWPAIGSNTIDSFRGNWLERDGILLEKKTRWELTVEKRPYDILLHKSPFSFSIIRYYWMQKALHVNWLA